MEIKTYQAAKDNKGQIYDSGSFEAIVYMLHKLMEFNLFCSI